MTRMIDFFKRLAYRLKLYRLHPAIAAWIFIDRRPLTEADIQWARDLIAQHPEWQDPEWRAQQIRMGKRWNRFGQ
jgi:hypothetical protein